MSDRRCSAKSRAGKQCGRHPIVGGAVCTMHGGKAPQVQAKALERVKDLLGEAIDPDRSLREAARIAYSDIRELFDAEGKLLPVKDWPDDVARAVAGIETVMGNVDKGDGKFDRVVKIKLWDKGRNLENLMKHHGQLVERQQVDVTVTLVQKLQTGRDRVAQLKAVNE